MADGYNGWANWETWNVALWVQNDEGLYAMARRFRNHREPYAALAADLSSLSNSTPDGASYTDAKLDTVALDDMIREL